MPGNRHDHRRHVAGKWAHHGLYFGGNQFMGMSPEQLQRVFERFYRADASGHIPGTGLGMSIVKEIIEIMGGKVSVNSEPAMGTAVTILLPVVAVAEG
ncbi:sensor histidine kinase [Acidovorax temperans]|uniref:sensor histidine kinase n=1 Tax=Acidovorax temperans TaxID=80878 RepID=UPI0035B44B8D